MKPVKRVQTNRAHRLNDEIRGVKEVRLTDENGEQVGIVSIQDALARAEDAELDLVEISPNAEPPVCRIMNYGKFIYEKEKAAKEQKKKQKVVQIKEIKFRPGTDDGDYQIKLRSILRFLEDGDKVKITVRFRGREMAHQDIGLDVLDRVKTDTAEVALVESAPGKLEGRQAVMVIAPKKK
ncbi:translation initiation factor IF-3 [Actinobacillus pleuropneumoniae]|uniref:translation initiation factor IF-3 n=1 Tax=Actinobacillus pleuropneumoniae TaxID=715 RepID=UPI002277BE69|nr:translation initiation factor IF-3 [Actinobacillus pleuropneumoniae]MCY6428530.1 translation initiation factor IF-3 [Actinobacillus pleuropneumoniae]